MKDLSSLDSFAAEPKAFGVRSIIPSNPELVILAVDQSISNSGYALIKGKSVIETGNIKTSAIFKGHEDNLHRSEDCYNHFRSLVVQFLPDIVAHETPPVGSRMMRPESSLMSALALRLATHSFDPNIPVIMVGAQKAKKRVTGYGNASKAEVREGVLDLDPSLKDVKPMNEAIYDAIAIGWTASEMWD